MKLNYKYLFILFFISNSLLAAPYINETRVFNLVMRGATQVSGIPITASSSGFIAMDADKDWRGTGPDGNNYIVSTLRYSYEGTLSLSIDDAFYNNVGCGFNPDGNTNNQLFIGWTVLKPGISGVINRVDGALYSDGFSEGVGVQSRYVGIDSARPQFLAEFNNSSVFAEVYVTDGPRGMYTMPGGKSVYVHSSGDSPNVLPYSDIYGMSGCDDLIIVGQTIVPPPIEPPPKNVVCNFSISDDINLGIVDVTTANGRYNSANLYTQCTDDATVTATIRRASGGDNKFQMGGLNLRVIFDNSLDEKTYSANTSQNSQIIWGQVTSVGTLTPGDYSQSMVVYLNYE